ncbi:MAG: radical SAM protein, partial [Desulfurivibrionaceae bacterium]
MKNSAVKTLAFRPEERNIFFHILTGCNLACRHCYINREQHGSGMVSREKMVEWLKLFYEPAKESNVIFLGGEPTMHPDLAFAIKKARELGYSSVTVDTNGYLFHNLLERIST